MDVREAEAPQPIDTPEVAATSPRKPTQGTCDVKESIDCDRGRDSIFRYSAQRSYDRHESTSAIHGESPEKPNRNPPEPFESDSEMSSIPPT